LLTAALVLGIIGAVFMMIGGLTCWACVACADEIGGELVEFTTFDRIMVAVVIIAGILAIIGSVFSLKGKLTAPILLSVAGVAGIISTATGNVGGLIGGILLVIAAILAFAGRNK